MCFVDGNGVLHELVRTQQKNRMTITYDGRETRQLDLTELFGKQDVFLSIFNPLYFIEELGDDGKNLLARYLPEIPHEDVMAELSDSSRNSLEKVKMLFAEGLLRQTREDVRNREENIVYLSGQRDLITQQRLDGDHKVQELEQRTV